MLRTSKTRWWLLRTSDDGLGAACEEWRRRRRPGAGGRHVQRVSRFASSGESAEGRASRANRCVVRASWIEAVLSLQATSAGFLAISFSELDGNGAPARA